MHKENYMTEHLQWQCLLLLFHAFDVFCAISLHLSKSFKNVLSCKTFVCGLYLNYIQLCQFMEAGKSNCRDQSSRILDSKEEHNTNRCCTSKFIDLRTLWYLTFSIHWTYLLQITGEQKPEFSFTCLLMVQTWGQWLIHLRAVLPWQEFWTRWSPEFLSNPNDSVILKLHSYWYYY